MRTKRGRGKTAGLYMENVHSIIEDVQNGKLEAKDKLLARASQDLIFFGRAFLPGDFLRKSESPLFHYEIGKKLTSTRPGGRICNILPRGFGKSVLAKAAILHKICFSPKGDRQFIAWVAEEQGQAIDHLKYIKSHLETNKYIKYYFGELAGDLVGNRWTEKDIVTAKGDRVISKGTTQRLRGRAEIDKRYTGIVLDDFESELNTKTPERRDEIKKWIVSTVYPALEETPGNEGWIWLLGTIVHYDSFLQNVYDGFREAEKEERKYPWDVTFYRAIENDKSIWDSQFSKKKLGLKKQEFIEAGLVNKFAQEYMNDARDASNAAFKIDRIQYYLGGFESRDGYAYIVTPDEAIPINTYIGVDVAHTATTTSDYQVILVMGIDAEKNRYVIEYFRERIPTFDVPEKIIEIAKKYQPLRRVTIETVAAQEMVRDMADRLSVKERRLAPGLFKGVKPPSGIKKQDRLETGLGQIVNGKKLYIKKNMTEIVDEFFEHPKPKHDDILDALYYANYYAWQRPPRSKRLTLEEFHSSDSKNVSKKNRKKRYNWLTGARM
jgi:phage terminase large subunit-like protein